MIMEAYRFSESVFSVLKASIDYGFDMIMGKFDEILGEDGSAFTKVNSIRNTSNGRRQSCQ